MSFVWKCVKYEKYIYLSTRGEGGWDSVVDIATYFGLDGLGIESWCGQNSDSPDWHQGPPSPPVQWVPHPSSRWCGQGMVLTTHSVLLPRLQMGWTYTSTFALYLHMHVLGVTITFALYLHMHVLGVTITFNRGDKFGMLCVGNPIISWAIQEVLKSLCPGQRQFISPPSPKLSL